VDRGLFTATFGCGAAGRVQVVVVFGRARSSELRGTTRAGALPGALGVVSRRPNVITLLGCALSRLPAGGWVWERVGVDGGDCVGGFGAWGATRAGEASRGIVCGGLEATFSRGPVRVALAAPGVGLSEGIPFGLPPGVIVGPGIRSPRESSLAGRSRKAVVESPRGSGRPDGFATGGAEAGGKSGRRTTSSLPPRSSRSPGVKRGLRGSTVVSRTCTGRTCVLVKCSTRSTPTP
jgi:hypothetical protein